MLESMLYLYAYRPPEEAKKPEEEKGDRGRHVGDFFGCDRDSVHVQ